MAAATVHGTLVRIEEDPGAVCGRARASLAPNSTFIEATAVAPLHPLRRADLRPKAVSGTAVAIYRLVAHILGRNVPLRVLRSRPASRISLAIGTGPNGSPRAHDVIVYIVAADAGTHHPRVAADSGLVIP